MPGQRSEVDLLRTIIETQQEILANGHDVEDVMAIVVDRSRQVTEAHGAVVELVEGDEMVYRAVAGATAGTLGVRLARSSSLSGRCVEERAPLRCDDTEADERVDRDACRRIGIRSMIVVPLLLPVTHEC